MLLVHFSVDVGVGSLIFRINPVHTAPVAAGLEVSSLGLLMSVHVGDSDCPVVPGFEREFIPIILDTRGKAAFHDSSVPHQFAVRRAFVHLDAIGYLFLSHHVGLHLPAETDIVLLNPDGICLVVGGQVSNCRLLSEKGLIGCSSAVCHG